MTTPQRGPIHNPGSIKTELQENMHSLLMLNSYPQEITSTLWKWASTNTLEC